MENLTISLEKILKSFHSAYVDEVVVKNVLECVESIFNVQTVFIDYKNNIIKKSKYKEINSLCFDFKTIFKTELENNLEEISSEKFSNFYIKGYNGFIMPIIFAKKPLGCIFIYSKDKLSETCIVCLKSLSIALSGVIYSFYKDYEHKKSENREIVRSAFGTLSYSEFEAIIAIFGDFKGLEKIIIMKRLSEELNITRSIIVNAIKKMESAGIIESRSLGMKGTYIKILNKSIIDEVIKVKK